MPFIEKAFPYLFLFAIAWVALVMIASIVFRRMNGKYIFRPTFPKPLFLETWTSGRSLRNLLARLGGANNCLWIAVADSTLYIGPHFPFNLLFLPNIYGLEYSIAGQAIRSVEQHRTLFGRIWLRITFEREPEVLAQIELQLKNTEGLLAAINCLRQSSPVITV